jgi:hypothetical protein
MSEITELISQTEVIAKLEARLEKSELLEKEIYHRIDFVEQMNLDNALRFEKRIDELEKKVIHQRDIIDHLR